MNNLGVNVLQCVWCNVRTYIDFEIFSDRLSLFELNALRWNPTDASEILKTERTERKKQLKIKRKERKGGRKKGSQSDK